MKTDKIFFSTHTASEIALNLELDDIFCQDTEVGRPFDVFLSKCNKNSFFKEKLIKIRELFGANSSKFKNWL